jgi:hypothetical protein
MADPEATNAIQSHPDFSRHLADIRKQMQQHAILRIENIPLKLSLDSVQKTEQWPCVDREFLACAILLEAGRIMAIEYPVYKIRDEHVNVYMSPMRLDMVRKVAAKVSDTFEKKCNLQKGFTVQIRLTINEADEITKTVHICPADMVDPFDGAGKGHALPACAAGGMAIVQVSKDGEETSVGCCVKHAVFAAHEPLKYNQIRIFRNDGMTSVIRTMNFDFVDYRLQESQ